MSGRALRLGGHIQSTVCLENPSIGDIEDYCARLREQGYRDVKPAISSNHGGQLILTVVRNLIGEETEPGD